MVKITNKILVKHKNYVCERLGEGWGRVRESSLDFLPYR